MPERQSGTFGPGGPQRNTAIETSGFFDYAHFKDKLLPWLDLIYYDIKLIDDEASKQYCGQSNQRILDNFCRLLTDAHIPIIPRIPLIPGITTTEENLRGIAAFLDKHGVKSCALMPYNPLWSDKLRQLSKLPVPVILLNLTHPVKRGKSCK